DRSGLVRLARRRLLLGFVRVVRRQRLPAGLPALRRRRLRADHRDLEGAAQYREHLQQGLLGLGGRQQQHLAGSTADLSLQGHGEVVRGWGEPMALLIGVVGWSANRQVRTMGDFKAPRTIAGFGDSALAERTSAGLVPR